MKWENVSVFISSTFQDMHGERDYLVKEVFPELLAWCESRRLHMYDIDLRWGITKEDSTSHNTVAACLHNIDRCKPFFICFLGQRRGWVPGDEDVSGRGCLRDCPRSGRLWSTPSGSTPYKYKSR